jgi:hypothetical protein
MCEERREARGLCLFPRKDICGSMWIIVAHNMFYIPFLSQSILASSNTRQRKKVGE